MAAQREKSGRIIQDRDSLGHLLKEFEPVTPESARKRENTLEKMDVFFGRKLRPMIRGTRGQGRRAILGDRERVLMALKHFGGESDAVKGNLNEAIELLSAPRLSENERDRYRMYLSLVDVPAGNPREYFRHLLLQMEHARVKSEFIDRLTDNLGEVAKGVKAAAFPEVVRPCRVGSGLRFMDEGSVFTIKNMVVLDKWTVKSLHAAREELKKLRGLSRWASQQDKAIRRYMDKHDEASLENAYETTPMLQAARATWRVPILARAEKIVGKTNSKHVKLGGRNAEWSIASAAKDLAQELRGTSARRNIGAIHSVANELIKRLRGINPEEELAKITAIISGLHKHTIIVADDLTPGLAKMIADNTQIDTIAFGMEEMTTSHSAVLLQNSGVRVVYSPGGHMETSTGDHVLIDCFSPESTFTVAPTRRSRRKFRDINTQYRQYESELMATVEGTTRTLDGVEVTIRGNVDSKSALRNAIKNRIMGVGLYRSEVEVLDMPPDTGLDEIEELLYRQYRDFAKAYRKREQSRTPQPIVIRLFDFGRGKPSPFSLLSHPEVSEDNQGVGFLLANPGLLRAQVRAIMRANANDGNLRFDIPYWNVTSQVVSVVEAAKLEMARMGEEKIRYKPCGIGVIVEREEAVESLDAVLKSGDIAFVGLGTNDLGAEMCFKDLKEKTAKMRLMSDPLRDPLHPHILKAIKKVFDSGSKHGKPVFSCGELGGDEVGAALLVGLGCRELTITPQNRPLITHMLSNVHAKDLEEIASEVLDFEETPDVTQRIRAHVISRLAGKGVVIGKTEVAVEAVVKPENVDGKMHNKAQELLTELEELVPPDRYHVSLREGMQSMIAQKLATEEDVEAYIKRASKSAIKRGRDGLYYYCRMVDNLAGGGLHARVVMALLRRLSGNEKLEVFSPRKAAAGLMTGFMPSDHATLAGSADNGECVYFRSPRKSAVENIEDFFRTTHLVTEKSRGD